MKSGAPDKGPGWKEKLAEKRAAEGAKARAEGKAYGENEVHGDVEPASAEALVELSKLMNAKLQDPAIFPDPQARDWFKLFVHMDDDRSGKITYREFSELCREELKMKKAAVPDLQLQGIWNALDDDDSGFLTAGEFVRPCHSNLSLAARVPWPGQSPPPHLPLTPQHVSTLRPAPAHTPLPNCNHLQNLLPRHIPAARRTLPVSFRVFPRHTLHPITLTNLASLLHT